mgnify:CR=1 FL=1
MSHNTVKISNYDLSEKSEAELKHYVQLIEIDIENYKEVCKNYPPRRMEKCGTPHLLRLGVVLKKVQEELDNRYE